MNDFAKQIKVVDQLVAALLAGTQEGSITWNEKGPESFVTSAFGKQVVLTQSIREDIYVHQLKLYDSTNFPSGLELQSEMAKCDVESQLRALYEAVEASVAVANENCKDQTFSDIERFVVQQKFASATRNIFAESGNSIMVQRLFQRCDAESVAQQYAEGVLLHSVPHKDPPAELKRLRCIASNAIDFIRSVKPPTKCNTTIALSDLDSTHNRIPKLDHIVLSDVAGMQTTIPGEVMSDFAECWSCRVGTEHRRETFNDVCDRSCALILLMAIKDV